MNKEKRNGFLFYAGMLIMLLAFIDCVVDWQSGYTVTKRQGMDLAVALFGFLLYLISYE